MKKKALTLHLDYGLWYKLDALAKMKNTIPYTLCKEILWAYAIDHKAAIVMQPEHYTARHAEEVIHE